MLACDADTQNLQINGQPQYICPSATPRPTDTPQPTSPPTYPVGFSANLNYFYVDVTRSTVMVQYIAQSVSAIQLAYSGVSASGSVWSSGGFLAIGSAPYGLPGFTGSYAVIIPNDVISAAIIVAGDSSYTFNVYRYPYPFYSSPNVSPCCLSSAVYPTPVPTYTPYPTPTEYVRVNDYFIGDPVYTQGTLRVRFRVTAITTQAAPPDQAGNPRNVYTWQLEVKNVGSVPYTVFPAAQMYISHLVGQGGTLSGVWGASLEAAQAAGLTPNYNPVELSPNTTQLFTLAAFAPVGAVYRLSYALDSSQRGSGPTEVPGSNIVSWLNAVNTICKGEIKEP